MAYDLEAQKRTSFGKKVKRLREAGWIPAEIYGRGIDNVSVQINAKNLHRVLDEAGATHLISIQVDKASPVPTLARNIQYSPVRRDLLHVDFYAVVMTEKVSVSIPIHVIGENPLIEDEKGTLVHALNEIEIEALPGNLPEAIEVDISGLTEFNETITVGELKAPEGVTLLVNPDVMVLTIQPPRSEEELEELEQPVDVDVDAVQQIGAEGDEAEGESEDEENDEG
jgi:large subunit ribosomal protein L25